MMLIGELSMWVALLMAAWSSTVSISAGVQQRADLMRSGERAMYATCGFMFLALAGVVNALLARDFSMTIVAANTASNVPTAYTLAALWSGASGSMLLWSLTLSTYAGFVVFVGRRADQRKPSRLLPALTSVLSVITLCFVMTMCFGANPYARLGGVLPDGRGMDPRLQNPGMLLQPPLMHLGLAASAVPFSMMSAALLVRRIDARWLRTMRVWALGSWLLLTVGILLGVWRTYSELGRAIYWERSSAEYFALMIWLASTLFLSASKMHEELSPKIRWSCVFALLPFVLTMTGLRVTQGELLNRVPLVATWPVNGSLLPLLVGVSVLSVYLTVSRRALFAEPEPALRSRSALAGVGSYVAVLGLLLVAGASIATRYRRSTDITLKTGESVTATDSFGKSWAISSQGVSRFGALNWQVLSVSVRATRNGMTIGFLSSDIRQPVDESGDPTFDATTTPGIRRTFLQDAYLILSRVVDSDTALARIYFIPLVWCFWLGGILVAIGGALALWPHPQRAVIEIEPRL